MRALIEAQHWITENRAEAVQAIVDILGTDRETAEATYDETVPTYRGYGLVTREGIENVLEILREAGRLGPEVRFEDVAYPQLAEELVHELGFAR